VGRTATVPAALRHSPFRGSIAVADGLLTARQLAGPAWRRLFRDVYISAEAIVDHYTLCQAAALLLPDGAALSHESAALLHSVNLLPAGAQQAHASVPVNCGIRPDPHLVLHRTRLAPTDLVRRGGLPVTNGARTAFDLGRQADLVQRVVALDALLYQRVVRPHTLLDIAADRAGWSGVSRFREAVRLARPGVESPMESRLRLVVVGGGLPEPVVQHEVYDANGHFVARLDLAYRKRRIGLEYDGDHHRERATFQRDAVRLNRLRLLGWTVLRFTADDVLRHPERVIAHVRAALKISRNAPPRT
jgi:hypothetical protein